MVGMVTKVMVGVGLFVGSLFGGLALTGRLNHEGTANIPVLSSFFPVAQGAADSATATESARAGEDDDQQGPSTSASLRPTMGVSLREPEPASAASHGEDPHAQDQHGEATHGHDDASDEARPTGVADGDLDRSASMSPEEASARALADFRRIEAAQGKTGYKPGVLFHFEGMPAGVSPEQLNEAWARVQAAQKQVDQRKVAVDLREQELVELADDISRRQKDLSKLQLAIEQMQKRLDDKIARFRNTVILVKDEEVAKLKENAETLASFESSKAAELVQQQWSSELGQREILRIFRFMEKESVNEVLAELPNPMVQDILQKRMQVSREAKPDAGRD